MADDIEEDFEDDDDDDEPSGGRPKKGKKKLLLIVLPLLLITGGLAGAYFAGLADPLIAMMAGGGEEAAVEEAAAPADGQPGVPVSAAVFYDLPEMLVDINSTDSRRRTFLKLRVALELASPADVAQVEAMMPRVIDNFQVYLRELRIEDLQGAEGMYRLREELLVRVNAAVSPARVNDVLFKEMLIQ